MAVLLHAGFARAQVSYPDRIGDRAFILDEARLIDDADEVTIVAVCDKLLTERQIPIIVVTLDSIADYGAHDWTVERYAHNLFDEWGIGYPDYNYGILLLVSKGDRRARIELGADWGRDHDGVAQKIMDRMIIPRFKDGEFSGGIVDGVMGLDNMARGEKIPGSAVGDAVRDVGGSFKRAISWVMSNCMIMILLPLALLARLMGWRGGSGGGGGSFSGGSFGGGFSGGGGASGSW